MNKPKGGPQGGADGRRAQEKPGPFPTFCAGMPRHDSRKPAGESQICPLLCAGRSAPASPAPPRGVLVRHLRLPAGVNRRPGARWRDAP
jgi:hypothetical protein